MQECKDTTMLTNIAIPERAPGVSDDELSEVIEAAFASYRLSPDPLYSRFPATGLAGLAQLLTQIVTQIEHEMAAIARFRRDHPDADDEARDAFYKRLEAKRPDPLGDMHRARKARLAAERKQKAECRRSAK
jgi:hypothetical protein